MGRARVGGVALRRPSRRPKAPETERKQSQNVMLNGPARKSGIGAWLRMLRVLVDVLLVLLGGLLSTSRRAKLRRNGTSGSRPPIFGLPMKGCQSDSSREYGNR